MNTMNKIYNKGLILMAAAGGFALPAGADAQTTVVNRPPMREAPTNEQLVLQLGKIQQEEARRPVSQARLSQDPSTLERPDSLMTRSQILCYGGYLTLVPKRAVLQYPKKYEDRLVPAEGVKVVSFPDFLAANRNWITTFEVSRVQAQGKDPLPKDAKAKMVKAGNLIVATFNGNPIEVLPLVTPEEATVQTQNQSLPPQP